MVRAVRLEWREVGWSGIWLLYNISKRRIYICIYVKVYCIYADEGNSGRSGCKLAWSLVTEGLVG